MFARALRPESIPWRLFCRVSSLVAVYLRALFFTHSVYMVANETSSACLLLRDAVLLKDPVSRAGFQKQPVSGSASQIESCRHMLSSLVRSLRPKASTYQYHISSRCKIVSDIYKSQRRQHICKSQKPQRSLREILTYGDRSSKSL